MGDLSWRDRAACKGVDTKIFFPHDTLRQNRWDEGLEYCYSCPVRLPCLDLLMIVGVCLAVCCRVSVVLCVVGTVTLNGSMPMGLVLV